MQKILLLLLLTPIIANAQWTNKIREVDSALSYLYQHQLFNGTVLIAEKGKPIYKEAFGIAGSNKQPLTTASAFNLASVSKQFFSMMVMMLKESGKLQYDDQVQKHLPSFPYPNITIRHLLNHTSGLVEYFELADRYRSLLDTLNNASMLTLLAKYAPALEFTPGEKFVYCNTNYTTLASVIEKLSGMPCEQFLQQRIAIPLKLKNTYIYHLGMPSYPVSRVFGFHYEKGQPVADDLVWLDGIVGDGNVYSSAEDLLLWDQALYTEKLVKQSTFKEAITAGVLNDGQQTKYGFGWFIEKPGEEADHTGGWVAFRTYIDRHIATNKTIILLDNSANFRARSIVKQILNGKPYALPRTQLISNVRLLDGTGAPAVASSLRIVEDRISDTGLLQPFPGEPVVDGRGLVLAPGFIDSHSHHERGFQRDPSAISCTNQGITTIVTGQDGESIPVDSLKAMLAMQPVSVNVATYTGHASLREKAMKGDVLRAASTAEVDAMKQLLKEDIEKGSLGLSTGLEYEEGFYSTKQEVISLAKTTAAMGGRYISHIRSEDVNLVSSIEEIIQIGEEARLPVQISHFKIALRSKWGTASGLLARLQQARAAGVNITADVYPYTMWSSTPRVLFPKKDFENEASAAYAARELFDPAASVITHFSANSAYEGKTISQIATMHKESDPKALMRVVREAGSDGAAIAGASMSEDDVVNFMKWNYSNICSDGADGGHPRGYGAFTRVLGRYVRQQKIMPLETAVYKMTGLTAEHLGFTNRGLIARNYYADLVLFDPATVGDRSTMTASKELSAGIEMVWVNGQLVYQQQQATPARPGRFIGHE